MCLAFWQPHAALPLRAHQCSQGRRVSTHLDERPSGREGCPRRPLPDLEPLELASVRAYLTALVGLVH